MTSVRPPPHAARLWRVLSRPELTMVAKLAADFALGHLFGRNCRRAVPHTRGYYRTGMRPCRPDGRARRTSGSWMTRSRMLGILSVATERPIGGEATMSDLKIY